jgi:hypothetical protein
VLLKENIICDTGAGNQFAAFYFNKNTPPVKMDKKKQTVTNWGMKFTASRPLFSPI